MKCRQQKCPKWSWFGSLEHQKIWSLSRFHLWNFLHWKLTTRLCALEPYACITLKMIRGCSRLENLMPDRAFCSHFSFKRLLCPKTTKKVTMKAEEGQRKRNQLTWRMKFRNSWHNTLWSSVTKSPAICFWLTTPKLSLFNSNRRMLNQSCTTANEPRRMKRKTSLTFQDWMNSESKARRRKYKVSLMPRSMRSYRARIPWIHSTWMSSCLNTLKKTGLRAWFRRSLT